MVYITPRAVRFRCSLNLVTFSSFDSLTRGECSFAFFRSFCTGIFHAFGPCDILGAVSHFDDGFVGDQIQVEHFVTVWTQNDEVGDVIVVSIAVDVSNFEYGWDSEPAVSAKWIVVGESELAVVNTGCQQEES